MRKYNDIPSCNIRKILSFRLKSSISQNIKYIYIYIFWLGGRRGVRFLKYKKKFFFSLWLKSAGFYFRKYKKNVLLRKYKQSFLLREYKNLFNITVTKFHFMKYMDFLFETIFSAFLDLGWEMPQVALNYTTTLTFFPQRKHINCLGISLSCVAFLSLSFFYSDKIKVHVCEYTQ